MLNINEQEIYSLGEEVRSTEPEPVNFGVLTFTALESGEFGMEHYGYNSTSKPNLSYSNDGVNWKKWNYSPISVNAGDVICFKGINRHFSISRSDYSTFTSTGRFAASGNIMSLLYGDDYEGKLNLSYTLFTFYKLFYGCTSLTTAPVLPATTLAEGCYISMFEGCTSLTTAPELPAEILSLPATSLSYGCYQYMFKGCTSLTTAPALHATTLGEACYEGMFEGCTSLVEAPKLPAISLEKYCYWSMFKDCTSLTTVSSLPATKLADSCYSYMFYGCKNLTTAPELPATELVNNCYDGMFYGCSNLNYVKAYFITEPSRSYTNYWLYGVASKGTFVVNHNLTWPSTITRNEHTIPYGWVIKEKITIDNWGGLCFTALEDGEIGMIHKGTNAKNTPTLNYFKNGGSWEEWDYSPILVNEGDVVCFQGINKNIGKSFNNYSQFTSTGKIAASGNIMSLLYGEDFEGELNLNGRYFCFSYLFYNCKSLTSAPSLPATELGTNCYYNMFSGCSSLTTAPELPATTLVDSCYSHMFSGCTSLTTSPELPATTLATHCYYSMLSGCTSLTTSPELPVTKLADSCYSYMFEGCTSLNTAPELPATTLEKSCYSSMFGGCYSITTAPALPATKLADYCYSGMFSNCTSLTTAPALSATTLADSCYHGMFLGCSSLTTAPSLPATKLTNNCYGDMFNGCTKLNTAPELPATTLAKNCYSGMFLNCTSLTTAPALPATTLADSCYDEMFRWCSSLTTAPELPATVLVNNCYSYMFEGCRKLNYVKANFTTEPSTTYTNSWLKRVASKGTFAANPNATWPSTIVKSSNTVPESWDIIKTITIDDSSEGMGADAKAIDLGDIFTVYWAMYNVGAYDPTNHGTYFQWKSTQNWSDSNWQNWRLPSESDMSFLLSNTTMSIRSKGEPLILNSNEIDNTNSITIPTSGYQAGGVNSWNVIYDFDECYLWTTDRNGTYGYALKTDGNNVSVICKTISSTVNGMPFRPVIDKVTITVNTEGGDTITKTYPKGTKVRLYAYKDNYHKTHHWKTNTGAPNINEVTPVVTINSDITYTAFFERIA